MTASLVERLLAVVGDVDGVALAAQAAGHRLGQVDLVVDDQHAHAADGTGQGRDSVARHGRRIQPAATDRVESGRRCGSPAADPAADGRPLRWPSSRRWFGGPQPLRPPSRRRPLRSEPHPCTRSARRRPPRTATRRRHADAALLERTLFEIKKVIVGQDRAIERLLVCLLARGHGLLEGVPGLAKTLAVETLARVVGGTFARLQFTPDLLPADIVGTRIYRASRPRPSTSSSARCSPTSCSPTRSTGRRPRCSPRCSRSWPSTRCRSAAAPTPCRSPFLVLATQNPIESEGVYPLPEAQRDRFLMKVVDRLPDAARGGRDRPPHGRAPARAERGARRSTDLVALQEAADAIYVDRGVVDYAVNLVLATREPGELRPARPRASSSATAPAPAPASAWSPPAGPSPCCGAAATSCPRTCSTSPPTCCATASCCPTRRWPRAHHRGHPRLGCSPRSRPRASLRRQDPAAVAQPAARSAPPAAARSPRRRARLRSSRHPARVAGRRHRAPYRRPPAGPRRMTPPRPAGPVSRPGRRPRRPPSIGTDGWSGSATGDHGRPANVAPAAPDRARRGAAPARADRQPQARRPAPGRLPGPRARATAPSSGETRGYQPGDDVRRIDWNVTARMQAPHVRETIADRELETWVVVDLSASLDFGTACCEKRDLAVVRRRGRRVPHRPDRQPVRRGHRRPDGPSHRARPAAGAPTSWRSCTGCVTAPRADAAAPPTSARGLDRLGRHRPGAAASPSSSPTSSPTPRRGTRPLRRLATRHEMLAVEVVDPRELELPDVGVLELVDPETGRQPRGAHRQRASCATRYAAAARRAAPDHRRGHPPRRRRPPGAAHRPRLAARPRPLRRRPRRERIAGRNRLGERRR